MGLASYTEMFVAAGFPEVQERAWSEAMLHAVVASGNESQVAARLRELFALGATELIVTPLPAGKDQEASQERNLRFLAGMARSLNP
jgi:alkanesulfonate monooxygenase SsuD/methylene tetrahydromethanopterin reductase-like flavin-dependent oxidoreductase (luciferase family)